MSPTDTSRRTVLLTRRVYFCASHRYHNPQFSAEENMRIFGKCNLPHGHGHNYVLEVTVAGQVDPQTGMVMNLTDLNAITNEVVMTHLDHKHLNLDVPYFAEHIPTCENLVAWLWEQLAVPISAFARLYRLRLHEDHALYVEYYGGCEAEVLAEPTESFQAI